VSRRLPASTAPVVSSAFYPFSGFRAATTASTRHLEFTAAGIRSSADATLDMAARCGWALHELPARHIIRTDGEAAVVGEVSEQCMVGFPPVGKLGTDAEVDGLVGGMGVERVGYPGASDDDAGVAVTGMPGRTGGRPLDGRLSRHAVRIAGAGLR